MRIREIREAQGLQQKVLAKNLGIKPNRLSQYETGVREPDLQTLDRIATELGVSVDDLMGREEQEKPTPEDEDGLNVVMVRGSDGSFYERKLSDTQRTMLVQMLDNLKPADDENL